MKKEMGRGKGNDLPPVPKGSKKEKKKKKIDFCLRKGERQSLLRLLIARGIDSEKAKERIAGLAESQKELTKKLRKQNKSEEEIKKEQAKLLEEL